MAAEGKVGNHLLIGKLVPLRALNDTVQNQDISIGFTANVDANQRRLQKQDSNTWPSDLVSSPRKGP